MAQLPSPQMSAAAIAPCRNRHETSPTGGVPRRRKGNFSKFQWLNSFFSSSISSRSRGFPEISFSILRIACKTVV